MRVNMFVVRFYLFALNRGHFAGTILTQICNILDKSFLQSWYYTEYIILNIYLILKYFILAYL